MTRAALALVVVLFSAPAFAQQPAPASADIASLGVGPIGYAKPIEADGKAGSEWLIKAHLFSPEWRVLYPQSPKGICASEPFTLEQQDEITDIDGDGKANIVRFDFFAQKVTAWPLPTGDCFKQD